MCSTKGKEEEIKEAAEEEQAVPDLLALIVLELVGSEVNSNRFVVIVLALVLATGLGRASKLPSMRPYTS